MKYFELEDDMSVRNRWHLGVVTLLDGTTPEFYSGVVFDAQEVPSVPVSTPGQVLDFSLTSFAVPVASYRIANAIAEVAGADLQVVPVSIDGQSGMVILNAVRLIRCLDESRSEFIKWTERDHRSDLAGDFRQVTRLVLDSARIPLDAHFFRVGGSEVNLIVSATVKRAIEATSATGAKFVDVTPGATLAR